MGVAKTVVLFVVTVTRAFPAGILHKGHERIGALPLTVVVTRGRTVTHRPLVASDVGEAVPADWGPGPPGMAGAEVDLVTPY